MAQLLSIRATLHAREKPGMATVSSPSSEPLPDCLRSLVPGIYEDEKGRTWVTVLLQVGTPVQVPGSSRRVSGVCRGAPGQVMRDAVGARARVTPHMPRWGERHGLVVWFFCFVFVLGANSGAGDGIWVCCVQGKSPVH